MEDKLLRLEFNMPDGSVSAVFSGDREMISILEGYCRKIPSAEISSCSAICVIVSFLSGSKYPFSYTFTIISVQSHSSDLKYDYPSLLMYFPILNDPVGVFIHALKLVISQADTFSNRNYRYNIHRNKRIQGILGL